jgi:MtaA/CmuA family methyltransferase
MTMSAPMTSIERIDAAIHLRIPDRVPVNLHNFQPAAYATGLPMDQVLRDGELLAQAMLDAWREFGHDMILLENGTACNAQACGVEVIYRGDAAPATHTPVLKRIEDVDQLPIPDPETTFPMCEILKAARILVREIGDRVWICARADQGPMDLASQVYSMNDLLIDMAMGEKDEYIFRLLDKCRQVSTRYAYALMQTGAHSTSIGEPVAGPDVISPRMYRKYAWRFEKQMVDDLKSRGIILHNHICGNTVPILDDFIGTGAQVLEIDHKTDPRKAKAAAQGRTCLLGNLDTRLLATGTPAEVDAACKDLIDVWKPGTSFILGPGCALGSTTPKDNIHALVESAKKYGMY